MSENEQKRVIDFSFGFSFGFSFNFGSGFQWIWLARGKNPLEPVSFSRQPDERRVERQWIIIMVGNYHDD